MNKRECAIVEAYTGICMLAGTERKYFYEYLQEKFNRPVYTHELADKSFQDEVKEAAAKDFINLCRNATNIPEDKIFIHEKIKYINFQRHELAKISRMFIPSLESNMRIIMSIGTQEYMRSELCAPFEANKLYGIKVLLDDAIPFGSMKLMINADAVIETVNELKTTE